MSPEPDWSAVRAAIRVRNGERATLLRRVALLKICAGLLFGAICGGGLWISYLRSDPEIFLASLFVALLGLAPFGMVMAAQQRRFQTDFYLAILPLLLPALDQWSIVTRRPASQVQRMPGHYFVARDEIDCDFHIEGSFRGVPFSVTQAVLSRSPGDECAETTFRGLIVWTRLLTPFPGDLAALRRPTHKRSLWRGTALPERLIAIPNTTHLGRWAYDFVTTDPDSASVRLTGMVNAIDTLLALKLEDGPQAAVRGSDAFLLLPLPRFGWDAEAPVQGLEVDRHVRPFAAMLTRVLQTLDVVRGI